MTIAEYNLCVEQYADSIFRFILKNLGDTNRAKDIVQETYEKLWEKHENVNILKSKSYLFTTAYHTMIDSIRREKQTGSIDEAESLIAEGVESYSDLKEILNRGLELLPEIQRTVLMLRDYEGYNYKEIESITGLTVSQVKVYIFRARKFLIKYIGSPEKVI